MSAIESLGYQNESVVLELLPPAYTDWQKYTEPIVIESKNGIRDYSLLCVASRDESGNVVTVRKDHEIDSAKPDDWLVNIYDEAKSEWREFTVLEAVTQVTDDAHDVITLQLAPDVSHHGPYRLQFSVNKEYGPDGRAVTMSHRKYYGRGTGTNAELQTDFSFNVPLTDVSESRGHQQYAEVISLDAARKSHRIGQTAVAGL